VTAIAVVIVNYNSNALLARCLEHLARQTLLPRRVIVVDNGSIDGSFAAISAFAAVESLHLPGNPGFAVACNRGMELARDCDWVAMLNPDAFPEPGWMAALVEAVQTRPGYDSFACRLLSAEDPQRLDGAGDAYHLSGLVWRRLHGAAAAQYALGEREVFCACAAAACYRLAAVIEAGGFDEALFCYLEDVDLGFRMRLRGARCLYLPDAVVAHVGSAIVGRHSDFQLYHGHRNLVRVFVVNMPAPLFWLLLPLHLALNLATLLWFVARGRGAIIWRAKRDAVRGLAAAWACRRSVQSMRSASVAGIWSCLHKGLPRLDHDDV